MTGNELFQLLERQRTNRHCFIRWWRNDGEGCDIELIDAFFDRAKVGDCFDGFELLDMEDVWSMVRQRSDGRVLRSHRDSGEIVTWEQVDPDGRRYRSSSRLTPEVLIRLLVAETGGRNGDG